VSVTHKQANPGSKELSLDRQATLWKVKDLSSGETMRFVKR
jgi:hypothetical protein